MTRLSKKVLCLFVLSGLNLPQSANADNARPPAPRLPTPLSVIEGYTLQEADAPLESAAPIMPLTRKDERLGDALAYYMKGRVQLERREMESALESFEKAIHFDPTAIDSYQAAIPLLLQKQRLDDAKELALQAAVHSEKGLDLVLTVAAIFAQADKVSESISLISATLKLPKVQKAGTNELIMRRDLGLYHRLRGENEQATVEYKYVFEAVSDSKLDKTVFDKVMSDPGKLYDEFGDVFLKAEQPELALRAYEEASKHREAKPGLHSFNLATVFQKTGKPEIALEELQKYFDAKLESRGRAALELLKTLYKELGKENELLGKLETMIQDDSKNDVLRYFVADELLVAGQIDRAATIYRGDTPNITDPRALVGMIAVLRHSQNAEELLPILTKAYQTVPRAEDEETLQKLAPDVRNLSQRFEEELTALKEDEKTLDLLMAHARTLEEGDEPKIDFISAYVLGKLAVESKRKDDAIHFYKFAIEMRNDPPAQLYTELGGFLLDNEHYEESIAILEEALEHPSSQIQQQRWYFLFFLSYSYEFSGETDRAIDAIREAQRLNKMPRLLYQEAWVFYHNRQWDEALKIFNQVIDQNRNRRDEDSIKLVQDTQFRISNIYVEQGDKPKGEAVLQEVLKDDPDNTQANNDLGYLWAEQNKNLDEAKAMIQKAIDAEPDNPAYQDSMGWVMYQLGDYEKAHEYLNKAVQHENGEDSTLYDHLGDALLKLMRNAEAKEIFNKALKLEEEKKAPSEKLLDSLRAKLKPLN